MWPAQGRECVKTLSQEHAVCVKESHRSVSLSSGQRRGDSALNRQGSEGPHSPDPNSSEVFALNSYVQQKPLIHEDRL